MVLKYLTELYNAGCSYSNINLARSALSAIIITEHQSLGAHPLISRFMKGVFNKRPPRPRYEEIWDVKPVLDYLRSLSPVKFISLKQLTLKLCCLLALVSAQRAQTLAMLSLKNTEIKGSKVMLVIPGLIKQSRPGKVGHKIELWAYAPDRRICIKTVLLEYLSRTKHLRKDESLFISYKSPYQGVSKDTISRWVRTVLAASGLDVNRFKAHSTRAASTSAASIKFVPLKDIIGMAGWSGEQTFQKYYKKPVKQHNQFSTAILS